MKQTIIVILLTLLSVVLQASFLPNFFPAQAVPDFMLVVLVLLVISYGFQKIWKVAALAGFLMDLFSFFPAGANAFSFLTTILIISVLSKRFSVFHGIWKFATLSVFIVLGTLINDLLLVLILKLFAGLYKSENGFLLAFDYNLLRKSFYNLGVGFLAYIPLRRFGTYISLKKSYNIK